MSFWSRPRPEPAAPTAAQFEEIILPHLNAAYNLARWMTRNDSDAQDVVQEASLRAFRFFDSFKGGDAKAWFLAIIRNTCRTWNSRNARNTEAVPFDEAAHSAPPGAPDAEQRAAGRQRMGQLRNCMDALPEDFREVLVMRELEEMSYREISDVTGLAIGTVMSRLSRARRRLEECVAKGAREASV